MLRKIIFSILILFLVTACVQQAANESTSTKTDKKETPKEEVPQEAVVVTTCEQVANGDLTNRAKVTVTYSNGQKESFSDKCLEEDQLAFAGFKQRVYCENLTVKTKLYNCASIENQTCDRGACV